MRSQLEGKCQISVRKLIDDGYIYDNEKYKEQFDREGKEVTKIIKQWETRLCGKMERGSKGIFSSSLSDKFWNEVRKYFPLIDHVGVTVSYGGEET